MNKENLKRSLTFNSDKILDAYQRLLNSKYCFGVTSDTSEKDYHVLFFDFDDIELHEVYKSLQDTQQKFKLSTIYLIKSVGGFNAFCLSSRRMGEVYTILKNTKHIDPLFVDLGRKKNNRYILRMDLDKKYIGKLSYKRNDLLSNSHQWFFKNIMNYPIEKGHVYDDNSKFHIVAYKSVKHGHVDLYA